MDFRKELSKLQNNLSAEEVVAATILNVKIILRTLTKKRISRIIFTMNDEYLLTSSVETDGDEPKLLFKFIVPLSSDLCLKEIKELLDQNDFYSEYGDDNKTLYWMPNRW